MSTRTAAIVEAARKAIALGLTVDDAVEHAIRTVPTSPAAKALARRLALSVLTRSEPAHA